jgi:hypothetical protein
MLFQVQSTSKHHILYSLFERSFREGLSALLVPQVLQKFNFSPSTIFSLKLVLKHLIRSTYLPWHRF